MFKDKAWTTDHLFHEQQQQDTHLTAANNNLGGGGVWESWGTHMLLCVVIIKQALKFHTLNTDLEQVEIPNLITDRHVKWGPFSLTNWRSFTNHLHDLS